MLSSGVHAIAGIHSGMEWHRIPCPCKASLPFLKRNGDWGRFPTIRQTLHPPSKGHKEDLRKYRIVTFIPGKITEWALLEHISVHMKETIVTGGSQHGLTKGKSGLRSLITFCDQMTGFVDEGRQLDANYLNFSKTSDIVS